MALAFQQLRDVILLEADALNTHADIFDELAKNGEARRVLEKRLLVAAIACRQRAKMLHEVLAASAPKAEAS